MSKAKKCLVQSIDNQKIISIQNNIQIRFEGILIYEMLAGYPPFFDDNPFGIYEKILAGKIDWPRHMDPIAKDLVKKLLVQDRTKRLGNMKVSRFILFHSMHMWQHLMRWRQNGADDVKRHRWFKGLDWDDVFYRKLKVKINVARHLFQFHLISFFFFAWVCERKATHRAESQLRWWHLQFWRIPGGWLATDTLRHWKGLQTFRELLMSLCGTQPPTHT